MKIFYIAVTEQGIYFFRVSLSGKLIIYDYIAFNEIKEVKIGKGLLQ